VQLVDHAEQHDAERCERGAIQGKRKSGSTRRVPTSAAGSASRDTADHELELGQCMHSRGKPLSSHSSPALSCALLDADSAMCESLPMILVAGSANLDFVIRAPRIPAPARRFSGIRSTPIRAARAPIRPWRARGRAVRQRACCWRWARTLSRPRSRIRCAARVSGCTWCESPGSRRERPSSASPDRAENAITVASGANHALGPKHLPALDGCTHLLLQLEIPLDT